MKTILAILMTVGASASAVTTEYGPGAYTKTVKVCGYANSRSNAGDCKMMTYKWYAPRAERVCNKEGRGEKLTCFNRVSTGNYGYRKFKNKAEADRIQREEGRSSRGN